MTEQEFKRFAEKIKTDENGCWLWLGYIAANGYGNISINKRSLKAHRAFYEHFKGSIPKGLVIDHLCRVRRCVNPDHLEAVTQKANLLRGETKAALHSKKTHCPKGHVYDELNTYLYQNIKGLVSRRCKRCTKDFSHKNYYEKKGMPSY